MNRIDLHDTIINPTAATVPINEGHFPTNLEEFVASIPIDGVTREMVQHEQSLRGLWPQDVVRRIPVNHHVLLPMAHHDIPTGSISTRDSGTTG